MADQSGNILRSFFFISSSNVTRIGLHILFTPIIVRLLGVRYGDYAFMLSLLGLLIIVNDSGVFPGARKFIAEDRRRPGWETDVISFFLQFTNVATVLITLVLIGVTYTGLVERYLSAAFIPYFYALILINVGRSYYTLERSVLIGFGKENISEPTFAGKKLVFGIVGIVLAYLGWDVLGLLIGHVTANAVALLVLTMVFARHVSVRDLSLWPTSFPYGEVLSFTLLSLVLFLFMSTLYHVDIIMLRLLTDVEQTSYYKAALLAAEFLWIIPIAIQQTLVHSTSELWSTNQLERINRISSRITRYTLLLTLLFSIGIAVLAEEAIGLYFGPTFVPAATPMLILLPGVIGFAVARSIFSIGHGKGDLNVLIYATAASALLNIVLNATLIPRYGMIGAAVATSIGYGSMLVFHLIGARRIGFDPLGDIRLVRIGVTSLITLAVLAWLASVIDSNVISLLVIPPVGFVVFAVMAIKSGAVDYDEVATLVVETRRSVLGHA